MITQGFIARLVNSLSKHQVQPLCLSLHTSSEAGEIYFSAWHSSKVHFPLVSVHILLCSKLPPLFFLVPSLLFPPHTPVWLVTSKGVLFTRVSRVTPAFFYLMTTSAIKLWSLHVASKNCSNGKNKSLWIMLSQGNHILFPFTPRPPAECVGEGSTLWYWNLCGSTILTFIQ